MQIGWRFNVSYMSDDSNQFQASRAPPLYICYIPTVSVMPSLPVSPILMYCLDLVIHPI